MDKKLENWLESTNDPFYMPDEEDLDRLARDYPLNAIEELAASLRACHFGRSFELCAIMNARSDGCPENCAWCAQSAHWFPDLKALPFVSVEEARKAWEAANAAHAMRFSLVASGRRLSDADVDAACVAYSRLAAVGTELADELADTAPTGDIPPEASRPEDGMMSVASSGDEVSGLAPFNNGSPDALALASGCRHLCASLGLLDAKSFRRLAAAGVRRYHCNIETAPSFFPHVCTTHGLSEKRATIEAAREASLEICCGGIFGLGESRRQRIEFAVELARLHVDSIPLNLLLPIPGTPLGCNESLDPEEFLLAACIVRIANPKSEIRIAAGREKLKPVRERLYAAAVTGAITGTLLTTQGTDASSDATSIEASGYCVKF